MSGADNPNSRFRETVPAKYNDASALVVTLGSTATSSRSFCYFDDLNIIGTQSAPSSDAPSNDPTSAPSSVDPTSAVPTKVHTGLPTVLPTVLSTVSPSEKPTPSPTEGRSAMSSALPSALPSAMPSVLPSAMPSALPSALPSAMPSVLPSDDGDDDDDGDGDDDDGDEPPQLQEQPLVTMLPWFSSTLVMTTTTATTTLKLHERGVSDDDDEDNNESLISDSVASSNQTSLPPNAMVITVISACGGVCLCAAVMIALLRRYDGRKRDADHRGSVQVFDAGDGDAAEFDKLLRSWGLDAFVKKFAERGWTDVYVWQNASQLTDADLRSMGMTQGHIQMFRYGNNAIQMSELPQEMAASGGDQNAKDMCGGHRSASDLRRQSEGNRHLVQEVMQEAGSATVDNGPLTAEGDSDQDTNIIKRDSDSDSDHEKSTNQSIPKKPTVMF